MTCSQLSRITNAGRPLSRSTRAASPPVTFNAAINVSTTSSGVVAVSSLAKQTPPGTRSFCKSIRRPAAMAIAAFAIVNTLTMNVLEQTRCLGLLRVVGMTRLHVFRMFLLQALVLGLLALLPGILMGWLQRRHLEVDVEEPLAAPQRTWRRRVRLPNPGLRVLRPTGTDDGALRQQREVSACGHT